MKFSFETRRKSFSSDSKTALSDAVCFIEQTLKDFGSDKRLIRKAVLSSEESAAMLIENAEPGAFLKVKIKGLLGDAEIVITMQGREINRYAGKPIRSDKLQEMEDRARNAIMKWKMKHYEPGKTKAITSKIRKVLQREFFEEAVMVSVRKVGE